MSETIVSLGRDGTHVVVAEAASGTLRLCGRAQAQTASLTKDGRPDPLAAGIIGGLLKEAEAPRRLRLLLPSGATALKRAEIGVPDTKRLSGAVIAEAVGRGRAALHKDSQAFVSLRPVAYRLGEKRLSEPPLGEKASGLVMELSALTAPLRLLADIDAVMRGAGAELIGVIAAPMALTEGLLGDASGICMLIGYEDTLAVAAEEGGIIAQARAPIGRRHLLHDLAAAFDLSPDAAAAKLEAVLSGRSGPEAAHVVRMRLGELQDLLLAAAARSGLDMSGPVQIFGLPPSALPAIGGAVEARPDLPRGLRDAPLLAGAARLATGLGAGLDEAVLTQPPERGQGVLGWLKKKF